MAERHGIIASVAARFGFYKTGRPSRSVVTPTLHGHLCRSPKEWAIQDSYTRPQILGQIADMQRRMCHDAHTSTVFQGGHPILVHVVPLGYHCRENGQGMNVGPAAGAAAAAAAAAAAMLCPP